MPGQTVFGTVAMPAHFGRPAAVRALLLAALAIAGFSAAIADAEEAQAVPTGVHFSVDGTQKQFELIAGDHTYFSSMASKVQLQPAADSAERFTMLFSYVNFRKLDYPVELPLPRGTTDPKQPMAAMITIGFGYTDRDGNEWAGPGRVQLEALQADGTLSGSFTNVSLPHTGKDLPNILLEDGSFTVNLDAP